MDSAKGFSFEKTVRTRFVSTVLSSPAQTASKFAWGVCVAQMFLISSSVLPPAKTRTPWRWAAGLSTMRAPAPAATVTGPNAPGASQSPLPANTASPAVTTTRPGWKPGAARRVRDPAPVFSRVAPSSTATASAAAAATLNVRCVPSPCTRTVPVKSVGAASVADAVNTASSPAPGGVFPSQFAPVVHWPSAAAPVHVAAIETPAHSAAANMHTHLICMAITLQNFKFLFPRWQ